MIKKKLYRKIAVTSAALFALFLLYLIPKNEYNLDVKQELSYVNNDVIKNEVFLLDSYEFVGRTQVVINETEINKKAKEVLEVLINGSAGESKIPNGFKAIIPSGTSINSIVFSDGILKVDFSKELLDIKESLEEKMIEAIVFTLTSIEEIDKVIIYVEGNILTKLPKTKINLPSVLDRSYGINKEYDLKNTSNIQGVTTYYVSKYNDNTYYVPVTKYTNDSRDKINVIVENLSSSHIYNSNLMSYLNNNAKLLSVEQSVDSLDLVFNSYIFSNIEEKHILEEVLYTINLSIRDNYDVKSVSINVDEEEIYKSVLKTIE